MRKSHTISGEFSLPVLAAVIRPPYVGNGPVMKSITSLHRFFQLKSKIVYELALQDFLSLRFYYQFNYYRYEKAYPARSGTDDFFLSLGYKF